MNVWPKLLGLHESQSRLWNESLVSDESGEEGSLAKESKMLLPQVLRKFLVMVDFLEVGHRLNQELYRMFCFCFMLDMKLVEEKVQEKKTE